MTGRGGGTVETTRTGDTEWRARAEGTEMSFGRLRAGFQQAQHDGVWGYASFLFHPRVALDTSRARLADSACRGVSAVLPPFREVSPLRVARLDQRDLLVAAPTLQLLFTGNRLARRRERFKMNKSRHVVPAGKAGHSLG